MLVFFDFEVFKYDWLVVCICPESERVAVIVNNRAKLAEFYEAHKSEIWIGYNSRNYDQYILKGILLGFPPKDINDFIIVNGRKGWEYSSLFNRIPLYTYDCMNKFFSLKQLESFMGNDAEANRLEVYKVIKTKQFIRLYYKSEMRNVFIDGYVQMLNIEHFAVKQIVTVTIFCPFPYLRSADESVTELSSIAALFHFPFTSPSAGTLVFGTINALSSMEIENTGSIETGLIIELYANGAVTNPKVFNYVTGEYIGVDYSMQEGDTIVIDTRQGSKTITLIRNAVSTNLFNYLAVGSKWLQLPAGVSVFTYEVSDGSASDLIIGIRYNALFEGV